jgi:hypothetical protein
MGREAIASRTRGIGRVTHGPPSRRRRSPGIQVRVRRRERQVELVRQPLHPVVDRLADARAARRPPRLRQSLDTQARDPPPGNDEIGQKREPRPTRPTERGSDHDPPEIFHLRTAKEPSVITPINGAPGPAAEQAARAQIREGVLHRTSMAGVRLVGFRSEEVLLNLRLLAYPEEDLVF